MRCGFHETPGASTYANQIGYIWFGLVLPARKKICNGFFGLYIGLIKMCVWWQWHENKKNCFYYCIAIFLYINCFISMINNKFTLGIDDKFYGPRMISVLYLGVLLINNLWHIMN